MADSEPHSQAVGYVARHTKFTEDDVHDILTTVQEALQPKLAELYEMDTDRQIHVTDTSGAAVFALPAAEWRNEYLREAGLTPEETDAALAYHQYLARELWGFAVETRTSKIDPFRPVFIDFPEAWTNANYATGLRFQKLLMFGLTPTEALDFWLCEVNNWDKDTVAAWRGVERPAVAKTLREATEKLEDFEDARGYYEERGAHLVPKSELDDDAKLEDDEVPLQSISPDDQGSEDA